MDKVLERLDSESLFDYQKRLIVGKLVDKTLSDYDFAELARLAYGIECTSDHARKLMYGSLKTIEAIDKSPITCNAIVSEMSEIRKERQKLFDERAAYNKAVRDFARDEEIIDIIDQAIRSNDGLPILGGHKPVKRFGDTDIMCSLNDIHYGAVNENAWCSYSPEKCANMMASYAEQICDIGEQNCSKRCYVWANGDFISGNIHDSIRITNKEDCVKQIMNVSELIAQFIDRLSASFEEVYFVSVPGNHSRLIKNKNESTIRERLDDIVEWYLRPRLKDNDNVFVESETGIPYVCNKVDSTMYLLNVRGYMFCGVHGDFDGNVSNLIPMVAAVEPGKNLYGVLCAHMHHNKTDTIQGVKIIEGGSFVGTDDYLVSKRIYGTPQQIVTVMDDNGIVCHYDIDLKTN